MAEDLQHCRSPRDIHSIRDAKDYIDIPVRNRAVGYIRGMAVSPMSGKLFAVDNFNCMICVFNQKREYIASFGTRGSGKGELKSPDSVAVDSAGLVYVSNTDNSRIEVFSEDGTYKGQLGNCLIQCPLKLIIHNELLYIANVLYDPCGFGKFRARITVYTLQGEYVRCIYLPAEFCRHSPHIKYFGFTPDGYLYVAMGLATLANNRLLVLTGNGEFIRKFDLDKYYDDCAFTNDGDMLLTAYGNNCIDVFSTHDENTTTGLKFLHSIKVTTFPHYIAVDKEGNIFVQCRSKTQYSPIPIAIIAVF